MSERDLGKELEVEKPFPVIGTVGPMGSGKETFANVLCENFGFQLFRTSDVLKRLALAQGMTPPFSRELLGDIREKLEEEKGPGGTAKTTYELALATNALKPYPGAIIDGVRFLEDSEFIKSLPNSYLVGITALRDIRFDRIFHRERKDDYSNFEDFEKRDTWERKQMELIFPICDFTMVNSGEIGLFQQEAVEFFIEKVQSHT